MPPDQFPTDAEWIQWVVEMTAYIQEERAKTASPPAPKKKSGAKPSVRRAGKKTPDQKIAAAKASKGIRDAAAKKGNPK